MSNKKKKNKKSTTLEKKCNVSNFTGQTILLIIVSITAIVLVYLSISNNKKINDKKQKESMETLVLKDFITTDIDNIIKKLEKNESFILYVGYKGCSACESYSPILQREISNLGKDVYYLNYKDIDKKSSNWSKLTNKIKTNQRIVLNNNEKKEVIEDSVGNIMKKHGYTPVTIKVDNGICTNAYIGAMNSSQVADFLK